MPLAALTLLLLAQTSAPFGWKRTEPKPGVFLYTPGDLKAGETYNVALYPAATFKGGDTKAWLHEAVGRDPISVGKILTPETGVPQTGSVTMTTEGGAIDGGRLAALYIGATSNGRGRTLRIVMSNGTLYKRYERGTGELLAVLDAVASARIEPVATKAEREARLAREREYKFVVAPGKGLKTEAVEAILHDADFVYGPTSYLEHTVTILLKDGTVHKGFRTPLDSWDAAASRKGEPDTWGKWKKSGEGYVASWNGGASEPIVGELATPVPAGTRLAGRWVAGSGGSAGSFSSFSIWGVRFDKDGRFQKDTRSGAGTTSTGLDIDGGAIFGGGSSDPKVNRGTYRLDGYTIVLRYDDGRIARMPFFRLGKNMIWFEDYILIEAPGE